MSAPSPERAIDVLVNRLVDIISDGIGIDDVGLGQMEWQAKKCARTDPVHAHMALGLIAAMRWDEQQAEREFQKGQAYGWFPVLEINYAAVLDQLHRPEDALKKLSQVVDRTPEQPKPKTLLDMVRCAYRAGRFHTALAILKYRPLPSKSHPPEILEFLGASIPAIVKAADELGLTEEMTAAATQQAWDLIRRNQVRVRVGIEDFIGNDGALFLSRTLWLPVSFEEAHRLDMELVALQADSDIPLSKFCVSVRASAPA